MPDRETVGRILYSIGPKLLGEGLKIETSNRRGLGHDKTVHLVRHLRTRFQPVEFFLLVLYVFGTSLDFTQSLACCSFALRRRPILEACYLRINTLTAKKQRSQNQNVRHF